MNNENDETALNDEDKRLVSRYLRTYSGRRRRRRSSNDEDGTAFSKLGGS